MPEYIRTFIAVKTDTGEKLTTLFSELKKSLKNEALQWVEEHNLHLTLRFLGDTTAQQQKEIKKGLSAGLRQFHPFEFRLKGIGYFKNNGQPKVLFAKLEDYEYLMTLAEVTEEAAVMAGFKAEPRKFQPHLTLARIKYLKNKQGFYTLADKYAETEIQQVRVTGVVFYQSILYPSGPVYNPLETFILK